MQMPPVVHGCLGSWKICHAYSGHWTRHGLLSHYQPIWHHRCTMAASVHAAVQYLMATEKGRGLFCEEQCGPPHWCEGVTFQTPSTTASLSQLSSSLPVYWLCWLRYHSRHYWTCCLLSGSIVPQVWGCQCSCSLLLAHWLWQHQKDFVHNVVAYIACWLVIHGLSTEPSWPSPGPWQISGTLAHWHWWDLVYSYLSSLFFRLLILWLLRHVVLINSMLALSTSIEGAVQLI